jgi:DNA-binding transcriptional LysR family regulator
MMKPYEQRFVWDLDWKLLRTFMVIVEQGGISSAASFLGLKQPTISNALKRLEATTGRSLIDRRPSHFSVTPAGKVLFAECSTIFGTVAQIPSLLNKADDVVTGHLSIALASHVVSPHLDDLLESYNERYPEVTYSFSIAESSEVLTRVSEGRATLGVCLSQGNTDHLETRTLFREFFGFFCGPKHRLFGIKSILESELIGENSVSFQTDVETGPLHGTTRLREQARMKPSLKGISSNLPEVRRMIIANIGIGALPVHVAQKDVQLGTLWRLPPYSKLPPVDISLIWNPKRSMNPAEKKLIAMFETMLQQIPIASRTYR